jgi:hypothetical protein
MRRCLFDLRKGAKRSSLLNCAKTISGPMFGERRALGINHRGVFTRGREPKKAARFLGARWAYRQ